MTTAIIENSKSLIVMFYIVTTATTVHYNMLIVKFNLSETAIALSMDCDMLHCDFSSVFKPL